MMMEIIGPFILSLIAGLSTVLGSLFIFIKTKKVNEFICYFLSFSMSIMSLLSIFDLMPNSSINLINNYGNFFGLIFIILTFLLGYLTIYKINNRVRSTNNGSSLYKIGILSMISLILHNFPEGIAVFMSAYTSMELGLKLCIAIMFHNIPEGILIAIPLFYSGEGKKKAFKYTLLSGLSEPLGALLSYIFLRNYFNEIILSFILIFVAGLMISLSLNEIYKEVKKFNLNNIMIAGILTGLLFFLLLSFI